MENKRECKQIFINDLKKIVAIGSTGVGKSSTLNTLCGQQMNFTVSAKGKSETIQTTTQVLKWRNSNREVLFIDTPGLADTEGRDTQHIAQMVAEIRAQQNIHTFLIVLNGLNNRFDQNIKSMLMLFKDIFGNKFIDNTAIVFTFWEQTKKAKRKRNEDQITQQSKSAEISSELRNLGFHLQKDIQCFFIDNLINTTSEKVIIEDGIEDELDFLNKEVDKIGQYLQSREPFICRDIQECMNLNDQLKQQIVDYQNKMQNFEIQIEKVKIQSLKDKQEAEENLKQQKLMLTQQQNKFAQREREMEQKIEDIKRDNKIKLLKQSQEIEEKLATLQSERERDKEQFKKLLSEQKVQAIKERQQNEILIADVQNQIQANKEAMKNSNDLELQEQNIRFQNELNELLKNQENEKQRQEQRLQDLQQRYNQLEGQQIIVENILLEQKQKIENEKRLAQQKLIDDSIAYKKQVQEIFDKDPKLTNSLFYVGEAIIKLLGQFQTMKQMKIKKKGTLQIDDWNGKFVQTEFNPCQTTIMTLYKTCVGDFNSPDWNYTGMVNKNNQPHGFGRAICKNNYYLFDGQFQNGQFHGYIRFVNYNGNCFQLEYKNNVMVKNSEDAFD